jgi:hypothetical protein
LDYIQVEKDLSSRADQFERAKGLIPQGAKYSREFFGSTFSMVDSNHVLIRGS